MPVHSRWTEDVPKCSLQQWIFGSVSGPLPDRLAFADADRPDSHKLSLSEYRSLSKRIAVGLLARGVKPGDRVLLFSGNSIFFPPVFAGIIMAGAVFTGANPGYVTRELAYQIKDSGAALVIAAASSLDVALGAVKDAGLPSSSCYVFDTTLPGAARVEVEATGGARHWTELLAPEHDARDFAWFEPSDPRKTICCLNYSSGTTGVPKGVEITHHSYVANGAGVLKVAKLADDYEASNARARGLAFLPLYHAYGQTYFIASFPKQGVPTFVMSGPFSFVKMLEAIQRFRITILTAVPPILVALAKQPIVRNYDLSSIESVGCGAAPLALETAREAERQLRNPELVVRQGWGMTELTCTAMTWDPRRLERGASVGEIMPNCSARLVDADGKEITEANKPGELWISGPTVMKGYWQKPKATEETVVHVDGQRWLRTGDIAYIDAYEPGGLFYIVDRIKELIKVKGNQVAPAELEALLLERPDVADAAVIGVVVNGEERPRAYVVRAGTGAPASGDEIAKWLAGKVTKHKQLTGGVDFVDAIPKNPSGKILRKILREKAQKDVGPTTSKL